MQEHGADDLIRRVYGDLITETEDGKYVYFYKQKFLDCIATSLDCTRGYPWTKSVSGPAKTKSCVEMGNPNHVNSHAVSCYLYLYYHWSILVFSIFNI